MTITNQAPKLIEVFTEESSQQITPLPEEHAEPPEVRPGETVLPPAQPPLVTAWAEVALSFGVWIASVVLLLFVPLIYALPYLVFRVVKLGPPTPEALSSDKLLVFYSVVGILPTHMLTFVIVWMVISHAGRRPFWKNIEFDWPRNISPTAVTLVSVLVATLLFLVALGVTSLYGERKTDLDILIESSIYTRVATAFVAVVSAPLVEELIYRGLLYRALEKAAGVAVAIGIVSLLFAGVHVFQYRNNLAVIVVITLLSITLTVTRAVTGKVLPAFIMHLAFNGIQSVLIVLGGFLDKDIFK
ncbi:MAG TPA: type II CAAX endopeptidase family protein [Pyrinomonadaceae bacterium]|nr:type II CAAX endopeptidase family protein [Pyrinomonadaceae bacterium]